MPSAIWGRCSGADSCRREVLRFHARAICRRSRLESQARPSAVSFLNISSTAAMSFASTSVEHLCCRALAERALHQLRYERAVLVDDGHGGFGRLGVVVAEHHGVDGHEDERHAPSQISTGPGRRSTRCQYMRKEVHGLRGLHDGAGVAGHDLLDRFERADARRACRFLRRRQSPLRP